MEKDKKYNMVLGLMIFFFIIIVGVCIAWGLGIISINKTNSKKIANSNTIISSIDDNMSKNENTYITDIEEVVLKEYIEKIYRRFEISIPEFEDINKADGKWLWGAIYNNCQKVTFDTGEGYSIGCAMTEEMLKVGKELFGEALSIRPPKDGNINFFEYISKYDGYTEIGRGGEMLVPKYVISQISRKNDIFTVILVEYKYDNTRFTYELNTPYQISLNNGENKVVEFSSTEKIDDEKYVMENKDKFVQKQLIIKNNSGKYNLVSSKIIK